MRAVIQRVQYASVTVDEQVIGKIDQGILLLLGAGHEDTLKDATYILEKTINLRIFRDDEGKMNRSLIDINGQLLVVSQFTLYGDARKGRRPSFMGAMHPDKAEPLVEQFVQQARARGIETQTGKFGAMMDVQLLNDGPVTILLDSNKQF